MKAENKLGSKVRVFSLCILFVFSTTNILYSQIWKPITVNNSTDLIYREGNVSIGSSQTYPYAKLNVIGQYQWHTYWKIALRMTSGDAIQFYKDYNLAYGMGTLNSDFHLFYSTNPTSMTGNPVYRLTIKPDGKVGIGTTIPNSKLDVAGDFCYGSVSKLVFGENLGSYEFYAQAPNNADFLIKSGNVPLTEAIGGSLFLQGGDCNFAAGAGSVYLTGGSSTIKEGNIFLAWNGSSKIGRVCIGHNGVKATDYLLSVAGKVYAEEVTVKAYANWPDFVFSDNYTLSPIGEVEKFIKENKHLPDMPSAKEMEENGLPLGGMQAKLLQKIEELTLYVIEQNKKIESLKNEVEALKKK